MSPRRSTASAAMSSDIVMGPPPPPPHPLQTTAQQQSSSKDNQDINEKYRKLKRRYFELEEKFKEAQHELRLSGERNVRMRDERELILQRVHELETRSEPNIPSVQWSPASAFPRSLLSTRSRHQFVANLRQAMAEEDTDDHSVDPLLSSRHLGPLSHKHADDELRERALATTEDDVGEGRRQAKRSRVSAKGKDRPSPQPQLPAASSNQSLNLHLAPTPQSQQPPNEVTATPPLVSNKGTKLRLKPPVKPAESDAARPPSPLSPIISPHEEHPTSYNAGLYNNGNAGPHPSSLGSSSLPTSTPGQSTALVTLTSPAASVQPSEIQRHAKPKRLKAHTVTSKSYSIPTVPRDTKGKPMLPLSVGIMTVISLGEVCMREHFHTERYIFPVGYEVTRRYHSTVDPQTEAVYQCSILDGGDGPKFKIVGSDAPNRPIIAGTATGAWSNIVKQANAIRNRQHSNSVSGPDFFGLGQNTIKHLIQELPGADRLKDYVWQHFAEGGPLGGRHATVIPALPKDRLDSAPGAGSVQSAHESGGEERGSTSHSSHDHHQHQLNHHHQQSRVDHEFSPRSTSSSHPVPSVPSYSQSQAYGGVLHTPSSSSLSSQSPSSTGSVTDTLPREYRASGL